MTTTRPQPDDIGYDEPELFPELMIYFTVRLAADGRWSNHIRVCPPNGGGATYSHGRSGGIMLAGKRKILKDLDDAFEIAREYLEPFVYDEQVAAAGESEG